MSHPGGYYDLDRNITGSVGGYSAPGAGSVEAYSIPGVPFVSSSVPFELTDNTSPTRIQFPMVTNWVNITNTNPDNAKSSALRFGFTRNGVLDPTGAGQGQGRHFNILSGNQSTFQLEVRCKEMWFNGDSAEANTDVTTTGVGFCVAAGLTMIPNYNFPDLTGSNGGIYSGVG